MSADIINLKDYRRSRAKKSEDAQSRANRVKFGRDKARKLDDAKEAQRRESMLDGQRLDEGGGEEPA